MATELYSGLALGADNDDTCGPGFAADTRGVPAADLGWGARANPGGCPQPSPLYAILLASISSLGTLLLDCNFKSMYRKSWGCKLLPLWASQYCLQQPKKKQNTIAEMGVHVDSGAIFQLNQKYGWSKTTPSTWACQSLKSSGKEWTAPEWFCEKWSKSYLLNVFYLV